MKTSLASFAEGISKLGLTEVGYAVALLWYCDQEEGRPELRPAYLAELMHDLSLRRRVNITRLGRQLLANRDEPGSTRTSFRPDCSKIPGHTWKRW